MGGTGEASSSDSSDSDEEEGGEGGAERVRVKKEKKSARALARELVEVRATQHKQPPEAGGLGVIDRAFLFGSWVLGLAFPFGLRLVSVFVFVSFGFLFGLGSLMGVSLEGSMSLLKPAAPLVHRPITDRGSARDRGAGLNAAGGIPASPMAAPPAPAPYQMLPAAPHRGRVGTPGTGHFRRLISLCLCPSFVFRACFLFCAMLSALLSN